MVGLVFLYWVHFLYFDEICSDIAICEVWLLQQDYFLSVDDANDANIRSLSPEDFDRKGLATLKGK